MSATAPCVPCCSTPQSVNIPGVEGDPGDNGLNGVNAYSIVTSDFVVPMPTVTVSAIVDSTLWMVIGQIVIAGQGVGAALAGPGPSTFKVDSITSATVVVLKYLGYAGDIAPGGLNTISAGCIISAAGDALASPLAIANGGTGGTTILGALNNLGLGYNPFTVYGFGTLGADAYVLTANAVNDPSTEVAVGGTSITLPITRAGTYLVFARASLDFRGTTFAASRQINAKIRNTATSADIPNLTGNFFTPVITTLTYTEGILILAPVLFVTAVTTDVLTMLARIAVLPTAGTVEIAEASIVAVKLY